MTKTPITVAYGDGIGPEVMTATLQVLEAAGAELAVETIEIGEPVYRRGNPWGIEAAGWESLGRTQVFLKAPITIPPGAGFRNFNVTTRKRLGLYANVRPCVSYDPFVETRHPQMDVVIIRENEEDLYTGIEYRPSAGDAEAVKLISRPGSEKIVRYAFEYARQYNRQRVACFTKDNVLPMTDGLFREVFEEIAAEYREIRSEHWAVDTGAAKLADTPEAFDVVVLPNLYGDILSEVAAQIAGSVGLAGAANIGECCAMFEALQGAAPRRAGQNLANPSGLLLAGVLLLVHVNQAEAAGRVHNAWLRTIEDGIHTYDIYRSGASVQKAGTKEFACAVMARLGQQPHQLEPASYAARVRAKPPAPAERPEPRKELVGADVYLDWPSRDPRALSELLRRVNVEALRLAVISNRGVNVWPDGIAETICTASFRCRFQAESGSVPASRIISLLERLHEAGVEVVKIEYLRKFDGRPGFSPAPGQ